MEGKKEEGEKEAESADNGGGTEEERKSCGSD